MNFNGKIDAKDIKTGIEQLAGIGTLIGKDNTVYAGMIEGINAKMNIDAEECFSDSYKKEALVAEIMVQKLMNGAYIDLSDVQSCFEHEHWRSIVSKFANKYGIK
ncbi:hypothetical protein [Paenibacillus spongiae]|uniref:Uncharacterized protein n=1 Tax=Paenibacillus spongiae TaxID=2909671 RepID=A0ABY5S6M3_9BACL|nr:hypothetical protein [Paenibacillus spongiae]UVI29557.1 hypothetical protein L1F29_29755 [Paenibacillus spongiae]